MTVGLRASASRPRGARITGWGAARPSGLVTGAQLTERFGKDEQWLRVRTGIDRVGRLGPGEALPELAATAAAAALADAGIPEFDGVDAVIAATCSWDPRTSGSLATMIAAKVVPHAVAFDLNAACAGFSYGLGTAASMVAAGTARRVLVVGAERMSELMDPDDLGTSILFGDGAGAAVVCAAEDGHIGIGRPAWASQAEHADVLVIPPGSTALRMRGSEVFRWAIAEVPAVAARALALAGVSATDIEVFVPHQANLRIVESITARLGLTHATVATDVRCAGNTSAASIPLAVTALRESGAARPGQLALLTGFGAGLSIAAQVVRL